MLSSDFPTTWRSVAAIPLDGRLRDKDGFVSTVD